MSPTFLMGLVFFLGLNPSLQSSGTLIIQVSSESHPVPQVEVTAGNRVLFSDDRGEAVFQFPPGDVTVTVRKLGFLPRTTEASVVQGTVTRVPIEMQQAVLNEEVIVRATRTEQRIEDVPLRVEVLDADEVEEKALMTPGDIAMLLNETSGLRVQVTSPSLGAANVRVQGLRGRYTQILADGLPLYGGQTGSIGLLQIPPLDLGQVEIIKGVASSLYGPSALGGVINLISRRPETPEREVLLNRTSREGTDAVFWLSEPFQNSWNLTLLAGAHQQRRQDLDGDGWADMAAYRRGILRPRVSWDDGKGRSLFVTAGAMLEDREGGTIGDARVPDGTSFPEELTTRRFDLGVVGRFLKGNRVVAVRGSAMTQRHAHVFGPIIENDRHQTFFGESAISGTDGAHTWTLGAAIQADLYRNRDVAGFDYSYVTPAIFAQDDFAASPTFTLSGSGRIDFHSDYGTFFNPRVSALVRLPHSLTARFSTGTGVFAPTPFTEETESVGLTNLTPLANLKAERAWSASADLGWTAKKVELNATLFGSIIRHAVMLRLPTTFGGPMEIVNGAEATRTIGSEILARLRHGNFGITFTHTFLHATELDVNDTARREVPLTPNHALGLVGMWEKEGRGRIGVEVFYTGRQQLDDNPYRDQSQRYWIVGLLAERRFGPVRLYINAENLTNARQTRYDRLVRPERHADGRWTVDAWAPLEGRVINGGLRFAF
jgi:outer membrane receptor for ferrienterochelin and colicins